ncbi:MAG TPA: hypothetical protein VFY22_01445 [Hydrogenophaga sp.]|nr:hypothetical protein [Hydrogenophaga sp.]
MLAVIVSANANNEVAPVNLCLHWLAPAACWPGLSGAPGDPS